MKPKGITRSQWWVLSNIYRHEGEFLTQVELARMLDVGKVTVGGLIDRLEENGLVTRTPDPNDRRSKRIAVSAKGRKLVKEMQQVALELNEESLQDVDDADYETLRKVLSQMKANLLRMDGTAKK
jgi:MarR family transcriptional regulator, transcriptional regulator for hemolysin